MKSPAPNRDPRRLPLLATLAAAALTLAGCDRPEEPPATSDTPTTAPNPDTQPPADEPQPTPPAPEPEQPPTTPEPEQASDTPWTLPEGWTTVPGERPMRLATFEIPDDSGPIEVALTRFPGRVGGELANVNRWRGQMGLPAAAESDLDDLLDRFEAPGHEAYVARIAGAEAHMLVVALHEAEADRTWFVRATAPADAIDRVEPELIAFARSIAGLGAEQGGG